MSPIPRRTIDSDLAMSIARIVLNWGSAETYAGVALADMMGLGGSTIAGRKAFSLPLHEKLNKICDLRPNFAQIPGVLFDEIRWINDNSRPLRNLMLHGAVHIDFETDEPLGFMSLKNLGECIDISDVPLAADHSAYAANVLAVLVQALGPVPNPDVSAFGEGHRPKTIDITPRSA